MQIAELILLARTESLRRAQGDLDTLRASGAKADQGVGKAMGGVNKSFDAVGFASKKMAVAATAAFSALAAGASIGSAIQKQLAFGSALAETSTLLDGNAKEMAIVEQSARDLVKAYGGSATDQTKAFYQAISAGAGSAREATQLLDVANQLAIGGVTSVTTAVDILTTATNVYASEGLQAADASDALFVAMKAGKTTITELSASLGKVLPLSQNLGVSFEETAGTVAALTKSGIATAEAVTGLRAAMTAVLGPSKEASDLAEKLGINFNAAGLKAMGFAEFMADVTAKTGGSSEAMQALFGSVEATTVALSLSGAAGGFLSEILVDMEDKAGATAKAFSLLADDDAKRLDVAMGKLTDVMLSVGSAALTALVPAVEAFASIATLAAENADVLGIALVLLASRQIPAAIAGLTSLVTWLATAEGLFIATGVAARGMAIAMNAIPFVAVLTVTTALVRMSVAIRDSRDAASDLKVELGDLMSIQSRLDAVTVRYYSNVTEGTLNAMRAVAQTARDQTAVALEVAQMNLEVQERLSGILYLTGVTGIETQALKDAKTAVEALSGELMEVEARLSAADHAQSNFNRGLEQSGVSTQVLATEADNLLSSLQSQIEMQRTIVQYGKDSVEVARLVATAEREAFIEKVASLDATESQKQELMKVYTILQSTTRIAEATTNNLNSAANEASRLAQNLTAAANALSSVMSATADLNVSAIGMEAQNRALEKGNSLIDARTEGLIASKRAELDSAFGSEDGLIRAAAVKEFENYTKSVERNSKAQVINTKLTSQASAAIKGSGGSAKASTKALSDMTDGLTKADLAAQSLQEELDRPMISAIEGMSNAFGDFVARGFKDFKDFAQSILSSFTSMISQMVAQAASKRILFSMGMSGGATGAAAGVQGVAAPGGIGGLGGGAGLLGGIGSALTGGFMNSIGSLASGGFGGMFTSIGAQVGTAFATGTGTAIAGAIGAVAAPLLAVAAVFSFFKKKTKELDAGLRVTVDGMDTLVETFSKTETKRFWGLSKKERTSFDTAGADTADPLRKIVSDIQTTMIDAAKVLNIGSGAFADFAYEMQISTKGMSEDEAIKKVQEEISKLGDGFAGMVPGIAAVQREGEGAATTLIRLSTSVVAVNDAMDLLGHAIFNTSVIGADAASQLADAFGGLEQMASSVQTYFAAFYSEAEQFETITRRLSDAFGDLGLVMPQSRDGFRELVDGIDTSTESGRKMYAALVSMSGAMDKVLPRIASFTGAIQDAVAMIQTQVGLIITEFSGLSEGATRNARLWRDTATTLRKFLSDLLNTDLTSATRGQVLAGNRSRFEVAMMAARAGDAKAAAEIPAIARDLLASIQSNSSTDEAFRIASAGVQAQVKALAGVADDTATQADAQAAFYDRQIVLLEELMGRLTSDNLTPADLAKFGRDLSALAGTWKGSVAGLGISLTDSIKQPMSALETALSDLQSAVVADRIARERQRAMLEARVKIDRAEGALGASQQKAAGIIEAIKRLESQTGVDIRNGANDAILRQRDNGLIDYRATDASFGSGSDLESFRKAFWADGGLEDQIAEVNRQIRSNMQWVETLNQRAGGPAIRQQSSAQGNAEMVAEQKKTNTEMAEMRRELRQLSMANVEYSKKIARLMQKNDVLGPSPTRTTDR